MFRAIDVSTSGLVAQRQRMTTIAGNIANANATRDAQGNVAPFQPRMVTFSAEEPDSNQQGSKVEYRVEVDAELPPRQVFDPSHPDADENGVVRYPNIDLIREFTNALDASRAYEANIAVIDMSRDLVERSMRILA